MSESFPKEARDFKLFLFIGLLDAHFSWPPSWPFKSCGGRLFPPVFKVLAFRCQIPHFIIYVGTFCYNQSPLSGIVQLECEGCEGQNRVLKLVFRPIEYALPHFNLINEMPQPLHVCEVLALYYMGCTKISVVSHTKFGLVEVDFC